MAAGVPYIQRWQNMYTRLCLDDSAAHGLGAAPCLQHDSAGWQTQAGRFSYRDSG